MNFRHTKMPFSDVLLDRFLFSIQENIGDERDSRNKSFIRLIFPSEKQCSSFKWKLLDFSRFARNHPPFFDNTCKDRNALIFPPTLITNIRRYFFFIFCFKQSKTSSFSGN